MKHRNHKTGSLGIAKMAWFDPSWKPWRQRRHVLGTLEEPARVLAVADDLPSLLASRASFARMGVPTRLGKPGGASPAVCNGRPLDVTWSEP